MKYIVEIQKSAGKKSVSVRGYNYEQEMNYTIPKGVKLIQVGLYEDYIVNPFIEHPTKVFEKTINFIETD